MAPLDGIIFKVCKSTRSAMVKLLHSNGYTTSYYHMTDLINVPDGTTVAEGTYLGKIGNELPCKGYSGGAHVHFSIEKKNSPVPINGKTFGGWTFFEGFLPYTGYAKRGYQYINLPGGPFVNYGPPRKKDPYVLDTQNIQQISVNPQTSITSVQPATPGFITTIIWPGGAHVRAYPSLQAGIRKKLDKFIAVKLICYVHGDLVEWPEAGAESDIWYKVESGWTNSGAFFAQPNTYVTAPCGADSY